MEEKTMQVMKGVKPNAVNWIGALIGAALAWWTGLPPLAQGIFSQPVTRRDGGR